MIVGKEDGWGGGGYKALSMVDYLYIIYAYTIFKSLEKDMICIIIFVTKLIFIAQILHLIER